MVFVLFYVLSCQQPIGAYVCDPCDLPCDSLTFQEPGICPHCGMKLVKRSDVIHEANLVPNEIDIQPGSGVFLIAGGVGKKKAHLKSTTIGPRNSQWNPKF